MTYPQFVPNKEHILQNLPSIENSQEPHKDQTKYIINVQIMKKSNLNINILFRIHEAVSRKVGTSYFEEFLGTMCFYDRFVWLENFQ